jgi:hypothetical protein
MDKDKQIQILMGALEECLEFFQDNMDVVDGDDGQPEADPHMQMATFVEQEIARALNKPIW